MLHFGSGQCDLGARPHISQRSIFKSLPIKDKSSSALSDKVSGNPWDP